MAQDKLLILGSKQVKNKAGETLYLASTADGKQVWSNSDLKCGTLVFATIRTKGDKYKSTDAATGKEVEKEVMVSGFNLDFVINNVAELDNYAAMKGRFADLGI